MGEICHPSTLWTPAVESQITATAVVGLIYGDEGKGKIIHHLAPHVDFVVRANGGANAGHTFMVNGREVNTHQLPSGIAHPGVMNVIAHGAFVDPTKLVGEIDAVASHGIDVTPDNLAISSLAHLVLPHHVFLDGNREKGSKGQGSTKSGISYVAADMALREGRRGSDLLTDTEAIYKHVHAAYEEAIEHATNSPDERRLAQSTAEAEIDRFMKAAIMLQPYIRSTIDLIRSSGRSRLLLEGAQAFGLDLQRGKYPYVTSSGTTALDLAKGAGINHRELETVIGVTKAIPSKVGGGAFVTRMQDEAVAQIFRGKPGAVDSEYGKSTGREREIGYLDLVLLKAAAEANGLNAIALTKADVLGRQPTTQIAVAYDLDGHTLTTLPDSAEELAACRPIYESFPTRGGERVRGMRRYQDLPRSIKDILGVIEEYTGVPVTMIGTGPSDRELIVR